MNEAYFKLPINKQKNLMNSGYKVFAMYPYKKASMLAIANEANISKSLLFYYFRDKKEYYLFLFDTAIAFLDEQRETHKPNIKYDFFELINKTIEHRMRMIDAYPYLYKFIASAYYEDIEEIKTVLIDCTKNTGKLTFVENILLKSTKLMLNAYPWKTLIKQSADACGNKAHVKKYVMDCFARIDKKTFIDIMVDLTLCLHYDPEFKFKNPVLLLCGSDDKTGNIKKIAETWTKEDNNCTLHFIEHAGHNANQDEPEVVNQLIIDFLNV